MGSPCPSPLPSGEGPPLQELTGTQGAELVHRDPWAEAERNQPSSKQNETSRVHTLQTGGEVRGVSGLCGQTRTRKLSLGTSPFPLLWYSVLRFVRTREVTPSLPGVTVVRRLSPQPEEPRNALCFRTWSHSSPQAPGD